MAEALTDDLLLLTLRNGHGLSMELRRGAADRIEEYCTEAAVAEEALLRCYMAAGGKIEELPETGGKFSTELMVERVLKALPPLSAVTAKGD